MSTIKEGLSLPGEADDKCCWFVPIKIGVIIIGICMILSATSMVFNAFTWITSGGAFFIYGVLMGAAAAPLVLGAWFYIKFFMADSADTRAGLTKACMLVILAQTCAFGVVVVMTIIGPYTIGTAFSYLISMGITVIIFFYYAGVAKRFASQA